MTFIDLFRGVSDCEDIKEGCVTACLMYPVKKGLKEFVGIDTIQKLIRTELVNFGYDFVNRRHITLSKLQCHRLISYLKIK